CQYPRFSQNEKRPRSRHRQDRPAQACIGCCHVLICKTMASGESSGRYICRTIARACDVLEAFRETGDPLRLKEVAAKTGLSAATAFRILFTLEQRGLVARIGDRQYVLNIRLPKHRRHRIGYAGQSQEFAFSRTVAEGVTRAAVKAEVDLVVLD